MIGWFLDHAWWLLGGGFAAITAASMIPIKRIEYLLPLILPAAIAFYAGLIALIWRGGSIVYSWYLNQSFGLGFVAAVAGLLVAVGLYNLRLRVRPLYGLIEIVIGTISILFATNQAASPATTFITAVGGIYVIVRGLDNIEQSISGDAKSIWERYLMFRGFTMNLINPQSDSSELPKA